MAAGGFATEPPKGVSATELDPLFGGALEEFTPARNELAKELRSDGKRAAADWVKRLRKPSRAAWLVNQLASHEPKAVARLLKVGEELRRQQEQMLAGSADRDRLRKAAADEQAAIDSLLKKATAIGREHGVGSQVLDRVGETLQATSVDPGLAEAVAAGRVTREQRASSLGLGDSATAPAPGSTSKSPGARADAQAKRRREAEAKRRRAAERELAKAEKRVERERTGVERAREALGDREERLRSAERELASARRELDSI